MDQLMDIAAWHAAITKLKAELDEMMTAPPIFRTMPIAIKVEQGEQTGHPMVYALVHGGGAASHGCAGIELKDGVIVIRTMESR